jgi:hypothetical protein
VIGVRDLSKPIARLPSLRLRPWLIRAGGRFHLALLRRSPGARIVGSETVILTTRGRVWPLLVATYPPFTRYQQRTQRRIPVIELSPVSDSEHSRA